MAKIRAIEDRERLTAQITNTLHHYGFSKEEIADVLMMIYTVERLRLLSLKIDALDVPPTTDEISFQNGKGAGKT